MAMALALRALGKDATVVTDAIPPVFLQPFPDVAGIQITQELHDTFDAALIMECSELARTGVKGLDRSPVLVAIGTGGASAGLAKQLRLRLEALLPQSLGQLAKALETARATLRGRFPDAGERRRVLDAALGLGGALDPLDEASAGNVNEWLAGAAADPGGIIEIVLRSGDPEDLTLREARLLGSADCIAYESGVASAVLDRARADAMRVLVNVGEIPAEQKGLLVVLRQPIDG